MRTTMELNDDLFRRRQAPGGGGRDALRELVERRGRSSTPCRAAAPGTGLAGGRSADRILPGVRLDDRDALFDRLRACRGQDRRRVHRREERRALPHDDAPAAGNPSGPRGVHGVTMRRVVICTGVLGGGAALVFALAAATATLFPHGTIVPTSQVGWGGGPMVWADDGVQVMPAIDVAVPERGPMTVEELP